MSSHSAKNKLLSLVVILALLSLRLGNLSEEIFTTPIEDAIFDCAFIAAEDPGEGRPHKAKTKSTLEFLLLAVQPACPVVRVPALAVRGGTLLVLVPQRTPSDIFIPPESLSRA